jgi:hypothetical protein
MHRVSARKFAPVVPALAWSLAAAVGWAGFHLLGGPGRAGAGRELTWAVCLLVAVAGAALVASTVAGRYLVGDAARWGAAVGVGWGVANTAGWFLAVEVGGPATGLVTGVAVGAAAAGIPVARGSAVGLAGVLAVVAARLLVGDLPLVLGLALSIGCGLAVVAAVRPALTPTLPLRPVVLATTAFGLAWVGAWVLADAVLSPISASLSIAVEILLAVAIGAAVLGWDLRSRTAEPVRRVVLRWLVSTGIGVLGSAVIAAVIAAVGPGTGPVEFLDVGTTVGLAVAAWCASQPTLHRLIGVRTVAAGR